MSTMTDLLGALLGAPSLPGARCRGRPHLFDARRENETDETVAARHAQAHDLCALCPALAACGAWLTSLAPASRPQGIVAGMRVDHRGQLHHPTTPSTELEKR